MRKLMLTMGVMSMLVVTSCSTYNKYGAPKKDSRKKVSCKGVKHKEFGKVY